MWPTFDEFKDGLGNWLKTNHPLYISEIGEREWTNLFCGKHHSMVIVVNYRNLIYFLKLLQYFIFIFVIALKENEGREGGTRCCSTKRDF